MAGDKVDVLVVDDDKGVLSAVRRTLAEALPLTIRTTPRPLEALEWLAASPPRLLITDFRMPGMNGVEVLREARRIAPDTVRILLTGQADKEHVIEAINQGKIYRYVAKPWDNDAFADLVAEALAAYDRAAERHAAVAAADTLRREVEKVGDIQRSLLPSERLALPAADAACSFSVCEHATGDYADTLLLPDGRTALLVGDVSGHGLGAALFVFTARALLRSGLADGRDLPEVLDRTNRFLCSDMSNGRFMTLFAGIHDPERETLTYANAGHAFPLLVREGGFSELGRTALPLGILDDVAFGGVATVPFRPGDLLLGYTDGLIEARNADREVFGLERLQELLLREARHAAGEVLARVRDAALAFAPGATSEDDLTLLAYRPLSQPAAVGSGRS